MRQRDRLFTDQYYISPHEIESLPEVASRELKIRAPKPLPRLERISTSKTIEDWISEQLNSDKPKVVRESHTFVIGDDMHTAAWVGGLNGDHFIVCDHVWEFDPNTTDYDEKVFSCGAVTAAINFKAETARGLLRNDHYLPRKGDEETVTKMTTFLLGHVTHHPEAWIGSHRGGFALIGGLAQTFRRSFNEMNDIVVQLEADGVVEVSGAYNQAVSLKLAA